MISICNCVNLPKLSVQGSLNKKNYILLSKDYIKQLQVEFSTNDCQKSFTELFNILYPRLFEVAKYYLKISYLAEEVVSDVFLKLWNKRKNHHQIQDLKSYLFILVKRQSLNALRDNKKNFLYLESLDHQLILEARNHEDEMFSDEFLIFMAGCINNLPEKRRVVFKMIKEDGMKYKEVAEILNLSEKTVEMHICNALKQLRADMNKYKNASNINYSAFRLLFL